MLQAGLDELRSVTDPLGPVTRFEYDVKGNLIAKAAPTGARTTIAYNTFGQPISTTDPLGNVTGFEYDEAGNLAMIRGGKLKGSGVFS